jgi:hypothetical protein
MNLFIAIYITPKTVTNIGLDQIQSSVGKFNEGQHVNWDTG